MIKRIVKWFRSLFHIQTREEILEIAHEKAEKEKLSKMAEELKDSFPDDVQYPLK